LFVGGFMSYLGCSVRHYLQLFVGSQSFDKKVNEYGILKVPKGIKIFYFA